MKSSQAPTAPKLDVGLHKPLRSKRSSLSDQLQDFKRGQFLPDVPDLKEEQQMLMVGLLLLWGTGLASSLSQPSVLHSPCLVGELSIKTVLLTKFGFTKKFLGLLEYNNIYLANVNKGL